MTTRLETLNCGGVDECGFVFGDTELVRLGDLPAVPLDQFAEYSADTLLEILNSDKIPEEIKHGTRSRIAYACGRLIQARLGRINSKRKMTDEKMETNIKKAVQGLASQVGNPGRRYEKSPFVLKQDHVDISQIYQVSIPEFVTFTADIFAGGFMGWGLGVPDAVTNHADRLISAAVPDWPA